VREVHIDSSYMLAEPDSWEVSTIAHRLVEINHIILTRTGLGSNVKLNLIELKDQIGGYILCTSEDLAPPCHCKV